MYMNAVRISRNEVKSIDVITLHLNDMFGGSAIGQVITYQGKAKILDTGGSLFDRRIRNMTKQRDRMVFISPVKRMYMRYTFVLFY